MASHVKIDPGCNSSHTIVYAGIAKLTEYDEPKYKIHRPVMMLQIDVIAEEGYTGVNFSNVKLELEVISPALAKFVWQGVYNAVGKWMIPGMGGDWVHITTEAEAASARVLLYHEAPMSLRSGEANGKTFRVAVAGLVPTDQFEFKVKVSADRVVANVQSCPVRVKMGNREISAVYLK